MWSFRLDYVGGSSNMAGATIDTLAVNWRGKMRTFCTYLGALYAWL